LDTAKRIIELRTQKGYSTNRLAKISGMAQSTLRDIEIEGKQPTIPTLELICKGLGITLADFFSDEVSDVPAHINELLLSAQSLTPNQIETLNQFIKAMTEEAAAKDGLHLVAESKGIYIGKAAANRGTDNPMDDLPSEAIESIERAKKQYLDEDE